MLSRVADSLYWMARYLERAENTARVLEVNLNLMLDASGASEEDRWRRICEGLDIPMPPAVVLEGGTVPYHLTLDRDNPASIRSAVTFARDNAKQLREHISSEMWNQLNRLHLRLQDPAAASVLAADPSEILRQIIEGVSLFNGIALATINLGECWQFIQAGRSLERAVNVAGLLDVHFKNFHKKRETAIPGQDFMEWVGLLKSCGAFEAYCNYYTADFQPKFIAEFLLLGADFPKAVRFSVETVDSSLRRIAEISEGPAQHHLHRLTGKFAAVLRYGQIDEILESGLHAFTENIRSECGLIHQAIYDAYTNLTVENAIAAV